MSDTPCALIALRDPITTGRLKMILKQRGWTTESTSSSEDAVSIYRAIRPRVVFLGIDLPPNDGHDTALQIRADDNQGRIVIITPIIASDVETAWPKIMGVIPPAPGLANFQPPLPEPPPPSLEPPAMPPPMPVNPASLAPAEKTRKKGRWIIRFTLLIITIGASVAGAIYAGYIPI